MQRKSHNETRPTGCGIQMRPQRGPTDWSFRHYNLHGNQQVSLATVSSHSLLRHYRSESTGRVTVRESRQVSVFDLIQGHRSIQQLTLSPCPLLVPFLPVNLLPHPAFLCFIPSLFLSPNAASLHKAVISPAPPHPPLFSFSSANSWSSTIHGS